jgi:hypothetical protein
VRIEPTTADTQSVVRDNPNVLGSLGVFDLDAGPVTGAAEKAQK